MMKNCRVCLEITNETVKMIQDYKKKFFLITGIELNDELKDEFLCKKCFEQLQDAWKFREKALTAHESLINKTMIDHLFTEKFEKEVKIDMYVEQGSPLPNSSQSHNPSEIKQHNKKIVEYNNMEKFRKKPYICDLCGERFSSHYNIFKHIVKHKKELGKKCKFCDRTFPSRSVMSYHERYHNIKDNRPKVVCELCGLVFPHQGILTRHMRSHVEPYKCTITGCTKSFPRKRAFHRHFIEVHGIKSPFVCETCQTGFAFMCSLKSHQRRFHSTDTESLYFCDECPNKKFLTKKSLDLHIAIKHRGEKNNICNFCSSSFRYHYNLKRHLRDRHNEEYLELVRLGEIKLHKRRMLK